MRISINGKITQLEIEDVTPLSELVNTLEQMIDVNFVITDIKLNEQELKQNWLEEADTTYLLNDDELVIESKNTIGICKEALENSKNSLIGITSGFTVTAENFRQELVQKGNQQLISNIENLQLYLKVVEDALAMVGITFTQVANESYKIANALNKLPECLTEFIEIQKKEDWEYLADMIEYELIPILTDIKGVYDILPSEIG